MFTLIFVGLGVGERFLRLGEGLRDRRLPPPRPLELERRLLRRERERDLDLQINNGIFHLIDNLPQHRPLDQCALGGNFL